MSAASMASRSVWLRDGDGLVPPKLRAWSKSIRCLSRDLGTFDFVLAELDASNPTAPKVQLRQSVGLI